jgi:hypothetical protein
MEKKDLKTNYPQQQAPPPLYEDEGFATAVFEAGRDAALKGQYCYYRHFRRLFKLLLTIKQMTAALTLT